MIGRAEKERARQSPLALYAKVALVSALASATTVLLSWLNVENPFIYQGKFLKLLMYSLTIFWPICAYTVLGLLGLPLGDALFYSTIFLFNWAVFFSVVRSFAFRQKGEKFALAARWGLFFLASVSAAMLYLW